MVASRLSSLPVSSPTAMDDESFTSKPSMPAIALGQAVARTDAVQRVAELALNPAVADGASAAASVVMMPRRCRTG